MPEKSINVEASIMSMIKSCEGTTMEEAYSTIKEWAKKNGLLFSKAIEIVLVSFVKNEIESEQEKDVR